MPLIIDEAVSKKAVDFIRANGKELIKKFCDEKIYIPTLNPATYFTAGSPGAGKTEFSKSMILELENRDPKTKIVRVDADDIRGFIPYYNGKNSLDVQAGASLGVEKLYDYIQRKGISAFIDGTFADYDISNRNVVRALNRKRKVGIFYIYQDPKRAWEFTKMRAALDGRYVPPEIFIEAFKKSRDNVNRVKAELDKAVELHLVIKSYDNQVASAYFNVSSVDSYLKEFPVIDLSSLVLKLD